jgi:hypothetical protein
MGKNGVRGNKKHFNEISIGEKNAAAIRIN